MPSGWLDQPIAESDADTRPSLGPAITTPQRPVVVVESDDDIQHEVFAIPRYRVKASAGSGEPVFEIDTEGTPNYCRSGWALKNGFKPDSLFSIVAAGDSMEPTIPDGASLIVHRQQEIVNGKVHVICRGDECYVKRLFKQMDGSVLVRSDNQTVYKDALVQPDDPDVLHVVGLVVSVSFNL
jgi:phage repressor protein C with HTH and peptisase S24 domain